MVHWPEQSYEFPTQWLNAPKTLAGGANAMRVRLASSIIALLSMAVFTVAEEGASINWESYKDVEFDFGESLLRVVSEYEAFAYATGGSSEWASTPSDNEPTLITGPFTTEIQTIHSAQQRATASAFTGWHLHADEQTGVGNLANAASGTTAIDDRYDPTVVAMSWAAQTASVDFGEEVSQGSIDWSPGLKVSTGGGAFLSAYDMISIHDPIVVWTRQPGVDADVVTPTTLFELTAEFDRETELHWNEIRRIQVGVDGQPDLVVVPNDGPFLDAGRNGTGEFTLRMESELLPPNRRGTVSVRFQNGIVTSSQATGIFNNIAPIEAQPVGTTDRLPTVGSPAVIDAILLTNQLQPPSPEATVDRFQVDLDVGDENLITNFAACSDGVHVSVGPAVDTIQTFTLDPMQRVPLRATSTVGLSDDGSDETSGLPRVISAGACLGEISPQAELLFGNAYVADEGVELVAESASNKIDRFMRLSPSEASPSRIVVFDQGENATRADTRRWTARLDVRRSVRRPLVQPVEPVDPVEPVQPASELAASDDGGNLVPVVDADRIPFASPASLAVALLDVASYGRNSAETEETRQLARDKVRLFEKVDGILLEVEEQPGKAVAKISLGGRLIAEQELPSTLNVVRPAEDSWQHLELDVLERADGLRIRLDLVDADGQNPKRILRRVIPDVKLSDKGYRLAIGSKSESNHGHDFDNVMLTFQDNADIAWDGAFDVADFHAMKDALASTDVNGILDVNLDGKINDADLAFIEKLIPNKIPGDANLDGLVVFADFLVLSRNYEKQTELWSEGDFDGDGFVRFPDFLALSANFESTDRSVAGAVPEPAATVTFFLGILTISLCRRPNRSQTRSNK